MKVVVFGAGGCVGGWVCEELSQQNDIEVVACVRKWASAVRVARRGVEITQTDLEDDTKLPAILAGAGAVVNATMPPSPREPDLTKKLYLACVKAGVRRFIQFSSAAVYGNHTGDIDENVAPAPISDYGRGKAEMENHLREAAATANTQVFIFRPSIIYGPFSEAWTVRFVERVVKGRWRSLGRAGEGTCNLVHAHDVAKAVTAAATADIAPGLHLLNLNGSEIVSWNEYIERLGDALGTQNRVTQNATVFRLKSVVAGAMRIGSRISSIRSFYRRSKGAARATITNVHAITKLYPTSSELDLLSRKVRYSSVQAARILPLGPAVPLEEGLPQSIAWCRIHGVV